MSSREGFADFVAARGPALRRFAYLLCGDAVTADDLVQSVLLKALRRWPRLDAPEPYLRRALVNEQVSFWRRTRRELPLDDHDRAVPDGADSRALHGDMWAQLAALPRRQRAVLVLRYYEDLDDEQIARVLDCATGTVRSLASRAFATLREQPELRSQRPASSSGGQR